MGVGYYAGRSKRIDNHQMAGINRVLVDFALPAALFTGTVQTPRAQLMQLGPLLFALFVSFLLFWVIGLAAARILFHHDAGQGVLQATTIAFPNTGFMGVPILGGLFGQESLVLVAISTVMGALMFVPTAVIVLEITRNRQVHQDEIERGATIRTLVLPAFGNAARAPLVWAPILGAVFVLAGIGLPNQLLAMLNLLGGITPGLAMFAAGLTLAAYPLHLNFEVGLNTLLKMVAQPLVMLGLVSLLGITGTLAEIGVILCALPTAVLATILATRYETYQSGSSSTLVLTSLVLLVILPVWRIIL
jgi:auxin efflux carrier (AEC)